MIAWVYRRAPVDTFHDILIGVIPLFGPLWEEMIGDNKISIVDRMCDLTAVLLCLSVQIVCVQFNSMTDLHLFY